MMKISSMDKKERVLITGGAGFIGSHVANVLITNGFKVRILDNLSPLSHDGNIPPWLNKEAEFVKGDVRNKTDWEKALPDIDAIIHLAAHMDNHLDFSEYVRTNIESVALLFEVIEEKKLKIRKIVAASSQSVYGEGKYQCVEHGAIYASPRTDKQLAQHQWEQRCPQCGREMEPIPENETDELRMQIPYGISKMCSEKLLMNLGSRYGIPVVALRYSIVLGPHQSFRHFYSGALRAFVVNVLNNEPISMNEDGQQTRDFINVKDVAEAHLKVLNDSKADFQVFNVGAGESVKVIELARLVSEEVGVKFDPFLSGRYRAGDARHSLMNISKLLALDWKPKHGLRNAVKDYINWVRQFGNLKEILDSNYKRLEAEGILKH